MSRWAWFWVLAIGGTTAAAYVFNRNMDNASAHDRYQRLEENKQNRGEEASATTTTRRRQ
jgi:hypothetical protein